MKQLCVRFSFAILAAAAFAAGCSVSEVRTEEEEPSLQDETVMVRFSASFQEADGSKTVLADGTGNVKNVEWTRGDSISIWCFSAQNSLVSVKAYADGSGSSTTFSASVPEADIYWAVHPADAPLSVSTDSGTETVSVTIPAQNGSFDSANVCAARTTANESHFSFKNICPIVKLDIERSDITRFSIYDVSRTGIRGTVRMEFDDSGQVSVKDVTADDISSYWTSSTPSAPASGTYYTAILPRTYDKGLAIQMVNAGGTVPVYVTDASVSLSRREMLNLGTVDTKVSTDLYVSPDGTGEGFSASDPMSFTRFVEDVGMESSASDTEGQYADYLLKAFKVAGHIYHFAAGIYSFVRPMSTYFSGVGGSFSSDGVNFTIVGDNGAENTIFDGGGSCTFMHLNSYAKPTIQGVTFRNGANTSSEQGGGALYIMGTRGVTIKDCVFASNTTSGQYGGGAIRINNNASYPAIIDSCTFSSNSSIGTSAGYGGAISLSSNGAASFNGCSFSGNSTTNSSGGAVYIGSSEGVTDTFSSCSFDSNSAATNGGAIDIGKAATVNITGGSFTNNSATQYGGAVNLSGSAHAVVTITGATVKDNSAGASSGAFGTSAYSGSTAAANMSRGGTLTAENCTISGNHASNGGVAYICAGYQKYNGCVFTGNWAKTGGAFYCGTGALWVNSSTFNGNYASASYNVIHSSSKENGITLVNNSTFVTSPETAPTSNNADINAASALALTSCTIVSGTDGQTSVKASNADRAVIANNIISSPGAAVSGATSKGCNMYAGADTEAGDQASAPALTQGSDAASGHLWYSWDGTTSFTKATADAVKAVIEALTTGTNVSTQDSDILTDYTAWLAACGGFGSDIRGTARSASAVWPGSYQQD